METVIIKVSNKAQRDIFVSLAKELKISVSTVKDKESSNFIKRLKNAGKEAKKIASGELKGKNIDEIL